MKILLFTMLIVSATATLAQQQPRTDFVVELSSNELEIAPGETKDITVNLLRSKSYSKSAARLGVTSTLPEDISISYEPAEGSINTSTAKITAGKSPKPGTYTLLLNCTMNNKSKSAMVKLIVKNDSSAAEIKN